MAVSVGHCHQMSRNMRSASSDIVVAKALQMPTAPDTQAIRKGRRGEWCTAAMRAAQIMGCSCLSWVNRVILTVGRSLPVYPQLRTYRCTARSDALCQTQTWLGQAQRESPAHCCWVWKCAGP